MNDVMARISAIQSRFQAPAATTTPSRGDSPSFAAALSSATRTNGTTTAALGSAGITGVTDGITANAADPTALAALTRALAGLTTGTNPSRGGSADAAEAVVRSAYATATPKVPASFGDYRELIGKVATEEGVPASLLGALVWSESGFDPNAVSKAGARGLAQLMPATADGLGVDIEDPADNLRGGARYLRSMLDRFGRTDLALAAYNAGPNAVARAGGIPPYQETQTYVTRVLARATALSGGEA